MSHLPSIRFHLLATVSLALCLSACEVGPDYEAPATPAPASWHADEQNLTDHKADIDQAWWKNFKDPTLNAFIEKAATSNFDLQIAEARIAEARADVSAAFAALLPSGDLKGTATREANQMALPGGSSDSFAPLLHEPYNVYQVGFDASWELDLFGGNRRAEEKAKAAMQAEEASRDDVRVSLLAEVARTYVLIRQYQAELKVAQKTVEADAKTLEINTQRFNVGEAPRLDVDQAEAALEQSKTKIPSLHTAIAQAEYSLDVLLGAEPGTISKQLEKESSIPAVSEKIVLAAPAKVIAQRPDIRSAERKLAAATAQQGQAVAKFFPDISLTGFLGVLNTSADRLVTAGNQSWLAAGSVVWPILSYGSLSANLESADAHQKEALISYQKTVIDALSDVEKSLVAYQEQEKFLEAARRDFHKMEDAHHVAEERYEKGLTSRLAALDAERDANAAQDRKIEAEATASLNLIALYKSLGGGWHVAH